jgi:prepilin-type processing-associated H-X9-DG protein
MICTYYPPNVGLAGSGDGTTANIVYTGFYPYSASSQHPGGVNMAFCDGSVKFIKNTISSWTFQSNGNYPNGVTYSSYVYTINAGAFVGIWQQLSTRAGGEVISADQY